MTCGCQTKHVDFTATRAAMCQTCHAATRNARGSAVACTIHGKSIISVADASNACPIGRHPNANGRVRWMGAEWHGVPEPLRWKLLWALQRDARGLIGCGCLVRLKESWAGPWLAPWMEGLGELRQRVAAALAEWNAL